MYTRIALFIALISFAPAAISASKAGWSASIKSDMAAGCVKSLTKNVVAGARQQAGIAPSEPLPAEMQNALDTQFVPEFKKACACTVDNVASKHDYNELDADPGILMRAAALIGSPKGCPLDI